MHADLQKTSVQHMIHTESAHSRNCAFGTVQTNNKVESSLPGLEGMCSADSFTRPSRGAKSAQTKVN